MRKLLRGLLVAGVSAGIVGVSIVVLGGGPPPRVQKDGADPRNEQTYIGTPKCAACHFEQFTTWKQTRHAKTTEILPAKYKNDSDCLKCHSTGFGESTGYKDATTASLSGTSCEACHGPGSKHAEITKQFAKKKKLSEEEETAARQSIYRIHPANACVTCHASKGHKTHPKYDKE